MAGWSQSHFLQSLGWATLNSFWQMALLWCLFYASSYAFRLSAHRKYQFSVLSIITGFTWFVFSFVYFFRSDSLSGISFFNGALRESNSLLNACLLAASLAYLSLLAIPSYRLFRNWQFVQLIRKQGLHKADLNYRLFVQKIGQRLSIGKKVGVYISELVTSPVTVGYLKPVILLPLAALNNLTLPQVEAILLHELSHIRRYDYLVNLVISIISTILYFNPFVRQFMKTIEQEREICCDDLVLQFGYDKMGYASALLTLEKISESRHIFALAATGRHYLLNRIERIVGIEKKKEFRRNQFAGLIAALFCIVVFNSILIIREKKSNEIAFAYNNITNPFFDVDESSPTRANIPPVREKQNTLAAGKALMVAQPIAATESSASEQVTASMEPPNPFTQVNFDEVEGSLTKEEKDKVHATVSATRKVLTAMKWKELENTVIGDAFTDCEKQKAKVEYEQALEQQVNWKNIEQNMKSQYDHVDWTKINTNISRAMTAIQLDSLQKVYSEMLVQLNRLNDQCDSKTLITAAPLPDQSLDEIKKAKEDLRKEIRKIKLLLDPKKVISL